MSFECPRCNFNTKNKQNFILHLNRKIQCDPIKSDESLEQLKQQYDNCCFNFVCQCSKTFKHFSSLSRHKKMCTNTRIIHTNQEMTTQNTEIMTKLMEMQTMILEMDKKQTTTNINTQNNNNVTINIASFGQEDTKHIENLSEFLTSCFLDKNIVEIIEKIHFDKEYPQNQNVRLKSLKHKMMETYVNGKWIITDKDDTFNRLINKGTNIIRFYTRRNKQKVMQECEDEDEDFDDIKEYFDFLPEDNDLKIPVVKKLNLLFVNDDKINLNHDEFM